MQYRSSRLALILLVAFTAISCDDDADPIGPSTQTATLRIVNAADIPDVQVRRVGTTAPLVTDLDFRDVTATCVDVPVGEHALVFTSTGVELATTAFTFEADKHYTAFLVAHGPTRRALVLPDDEAASAGNNALRFINATDADGDVYVTPPGGAVDAGFRAIGNMGILATSNFLPAYVHRATQHTQVRLFDPGATTSPRADFALAGLPTSRLATIVFTTTDPTAFLVTPCE